MPQRMRVVVGVSGSLGSLAALHRAVAEARRSGGEVLALHTWEPPSGEFGHRRSPCPPLLAAVREAATACLADAMTEAFGGADPGVPLAARTVRGRTAPVLLAAAGRPTDLLVLGPSGSWLHRGLRGSVGTQCLRRAGCPVLVVPRPELALDLRGLSARRVDAELRELVEGRR
ncbi:universal stress protein [Streptomyces sp. TLI_171]|uniref:universal stress protein n=1 Tax=Streptomyces sp. TLI_171 TaxID=1938859 RepID=UPI000C1A3A75|nr:universal stress protein [Streptomyces sp. TLI_171]RKE19966.1 nucleotide-binding universal stress UspA family protein [Streptomyces sp. TLI_171]